MFDLVTCKRVVKQAFVCCKKDHQIYHGSDLPKRFDPVRPGSNQSKVKLSVRFRVRFGLFRPIKKSDFSIYLFFVSFFVKLFFCWIWFFFYFRFPQQPTPLSCFGGGADGPLLIVTTVKSLQLKIIFILFRSK